MNSFKSLIIANTLLFSVQSFAESPLATMSGTSDKFDQCQIHNEKVVITQNSHPHRVTQEVEGGKELQDQLIQLNRLTKPTLAGKGAETFQWMTFQSTYSVFNEQLGFLEDFLAEGFKNVRNEAPESHQLKNLMHQICDSIPKFKIFGEFEILLDVGTQVFTDYIRIKTKYESFTRTHRITGEYEFPQGFVAEIKNLEAHNDTFQFEFLVEEGQEPYLVLLKGNFKNEEEIEGQLIIKETQKILGRFTGRRIQ